MIEKIYNILNDPTTYRFIKYENPPKPTKVLAEIILAACEEMGMQPPDPLGNIKFEWESEDEATSSNRKSSR